MPEDDKGAQQTNALNPKFTGNAYVIISKPQPELNNPAQDALIEALQEANKIIQRTIGLASEWPSAIQYINCQKQIEAALAMVKE